jgi:hypothetical protein
MDATGRVDADGGVSGRPIDVRDGDDEEAPLLSRDRTQRPKSYEEGCR